MGNKIGLGIRFWEVEVVPALGFWGFLTKRKSVKATFHSTIFHIPMRPVREDQRHRRRFTC